MRCGGVRGNAQGGRYQQSGRVWGRERVRSLKKRIKVCAKIFTIGIKAERGDWED